MQITVNHVVDSDDWQSSYGPMKGWYFMATDANGNEGLFQINTKPTHALTAGTTFDFQPSGQTVERGGYTYSKGKRANNPPQGGGNQRPATPAAPSGGSPAQRPAKRLTEGEAVELLKRLTAAGLEPSERVTILLATMRGEIDSPPQPQRLPMPAAKPMPQGYAPQEQPQGENIPF